MGKPECFYCFIAFILSALTIINHFFLFTEHREILVCFNHCNSVLINVIVCVFRVPWPFYYYSDLIAI